MIEMVKPGLERVDDKTDPSYAKFEVQPLERGYGTTLGNALRRVLLSSLPGAAPTCVKIDGVLHEFSTIPGVKEDVTEIILNVKRIIAKVYSDTPKTVYIEATGAGEVLAKDIVTDHEIDIINGDLHIATLSDKARLYMEIVFENGRGYVTSEKNKEKMQNVIGVIPVDSIYTPIRNVKYAIEQYRVEQKTDYDKLVLEIATDGSIHPKDALKEAAKILIHHFMLFSDEKITRYTKVFFAFATNSATLRFARSMNSSISQLASLLIF